MRLGNLKNQLGIEFPVANVINGQKNRAALGDIFSYEIEIFDMSNVLDVLLGKGWDFYGTRDIGSQSGEMLERESADACGRHFLVERHRQIFPCEAAVAGQDSPQQCAHRLTENENHRKRQESDKTEGNQCENVNQTICHDGE